MKGTDGEGKRSGVGQCEATVSETALVTSRLNAWMDFSGQQSAGPWHCKGRSKWGRENDQREGFKWQLRNVCSALSSPWFPATVMWGMLGLGRGMLPSAMSLADKIRILHLSDGRLIHPHIFFTFGQNPCSLCLGEPLSQSTQHW